ncbi:LLM class flavin-dependent oxidoreductase [Streptomyces sp. OfavH-34-F]|uniref:LLM class flavin-dependent oxidoreductase n=1 Tax=Streptomyces sp. OfavH-34-F TaxID=2917760 RepID=UPI001EF1D6B1|nr:LLM class flavin-dependent oxidoreductase [Streptomyces sp. OfavH-34-F]MCG7525535.1 LLM class flavin-dependent oxidoreductase [Streptomyces sp. OfavH-34-F]
MLNVYATCPPSSGARPEEFRRDLARSARWTDDAGLRGLLIFTDHDVVDPWVAAQMLLQQSERLVPLVAAQPPYTHPYAVARMVSSLMFLYGRPVDLNLITGGSPYRMRTIGDALEHDVRYDRLVEYGEVIRHLLTSTEPVTYEGDHYRVNRLSLFPPADPALLPRLFVAGSSDACLDAERRLGVVRLRYPRALQEYEPGSPELRGGGLRIGILAREDHDEAWRVAHGRFPDDPDGERQYRIANRFSDSAWMKRLSADAAAQEAGPSPYWMHPLRTSKEYCPYLVGSYEEVGAYLARYLTMGINTIVLNVPHEEADLHHAALALRHAEKLAAGTETRP